MRGQKKTPEWMEIHTGGSCGEQPFSDTQCTGLHVPRLSYFCEESKIIFTVYRGVGNSLGI